MSSVVEQDPACPPSRAPHEAGRTRAVRARVTAFVDSAVYAELARSPIAKGIARFSFREIETGDSVLTTYVVNPIAAASTLAQAKNALDAATQVATVVQQIASGKG